MLSYTLVSGCGIQSSSNRLFEAIELGDSSALGNLNDLQEFVNIPDDQGRYPLHLASWKGDYEMVRFLLDNGADVNLTNEGGSALDRALGAGYGSVAKLLLEAGAQVNNEMNITGHSLTQYIRQGDLELVELLLQQGADVNYKISIVLPLSQWVFQYNCFHNTFYLHGAGGYPDYYDANCPAFSHGALSGVGDVGMLTIANSSNLPNDIKVQMIHLLLQYNAQPQKYYAASSISLGLTAESAVYTYSDVTQIIELSRSSETLRSLLEEIGILSDTTTDP